MRKAASAALIAVMVAACASAPRKPVAVAAQPQPAEPRTLMDSYGVIDPWENPDVTAAAPKGWVEGSADDLPASTVAVFVHPSHQARIFVATVPSDGERPADRVHSYIPADLQEGATSSIVSIGPDDEWASISWTAHETRRRAVGAQGKIHLKGVGGRPDLQVLVSGIWPQDLSREMVPAFDAVVKSVSVR